MKGHIGPLSHFGNSEITVPTMKFAGITPSIKQRWNRENISELHWFLFANVCSLPMAGK
jgi:hypothetical protein